MSNKNYLTNRFFFKNTNDLKNFMNCFALFKSRFIEGQILHIKNLYILDIGFKYSLDLCKNYSNKNIIFLKLKKAETLFNNFSISELDLLADYIYKFNWIIIKKIFQNKYLVLGRFLNIVHGGFSIGICGAIGFLPKKFFVISNKNMVSIFSIINLNLIKKTFIVSQKHINKIVARTLFKLSSKIMYIVKN